jgi:hypothetical protein
MHVLQNEAYENWATPPLSEATTEYFTRFLCNANQIARNTGQYVDEFGAADALATRLGPAAFEVLARLHFHNDQTLLVNAMAKLGLPFKRWVDAVKERRWPDANALLSPAAAAVAAAPAFDAGAFATATGLSP